MADVRRALLMGSGANRGAYYAGFAGSLARAGIRFDLLAGVSAGGVTAAWMAAGQAEECIESWRVASHWRFAPHPALQLGRYRTSDRLLQLITLRMMNLERARTSTAEVRLGAARLLPGTSLGRRRAELHVFSSREARDASHLGLMLRATGFVPIMNGFRTAIAIDGERYLDGGVVARVPLSMVGERYDELWVSAVSPHGIADLRRELERWRGTSRLVVVTPSAPLPVGRWTMSWPRLEAAIALGAHDMATAAQAVRHGPGDVLVGRHADLLRAALGAAVR